MKHLFLLQFIALLAVGSTISSRVAARSASKTLLAVFARVRSEEVRGATNDLFR